MLPEAVALQNSTLGSITMPTWHGPTPSQIEPTTTTVAKLAKFKNPHLIYSNRYVVTIKIKSVVPNQSCWYLACTVPGCKKTVKPLPQGDGYKCTGSACTGTNGDPRYRLAILVTDPIDPPNGDEPPTVEMVLFGATAEEIIGCLVNTLINVGGGFGAFVPTRITSLYGKQYDLRISVSPLSLQRPDIAYQVDAILGVPAIAVTTLTSHAERTPAPIENIPDLHKEATEAITPDPKQVTPQTITDTPASNKDIERIPAGGQKRPVAHVEHQVPTDPTD